MIITTWAYIQVLAKLFMKDHRITAFTFNPQCLRVALRENIALIFGLTKLEIQFIL